MLSWEKLKLLKNANKSDETAVSKEAAVGTLQDILDAVHLQAK